MDLSEKLKSDTVKYKIFFEHLEGENRLNDKLPNDGTKHDDSAEYADLIRYKKSMEREGSLSFMN